MLKYFKIAALVLLALPLASMAQAQNYTLRPSYGSVNLRAGFLPDPYRRTVRGGGDHYFSGGGGCPGGAWFANAPDFRLNYSRGNYALSIYVRAPGDTALLVNDPNGNWFCNDDYSGLNPGLDFNNPLSGQYDIWVGTYNRSRVRGSVIHITEIGAFSN